MAALEHRGLTTIALSDFEVEQNYQNLEPEFSFYRELSKMLILMREKSGKTQREVAVLMDTTPSAVARLESTTRKKPHAPCLSTLLRYAAAVNCELKIELVPQRDAAV